MVVRIGGVELNPRSTAQGYGDRRQVQGPSVTPGVNVSGLSDLAGAVAGMGAAGQRYYATRIGEEDDRRNYDALEKWNRFQGEFSRRTEDAKTRQAIDGAGYTGYVSGEYEKGYAEFEKQIDADLRPQFRARGEALKQDSILRADGWTREQTRSHALFSTGEATDDAAKAAYQDPTADVEGEVAERIANAPGLTAQEKEELADKALREINGARFGGVVRKGAENSFIAPFTSEVGRRLAPAVMKVESSGNPNATSPAGAVGLMQVMPSTGAEIAADLQDPNWPADPKNWAAYLKRPDVSKQYGTFYLNKQLQRYNGDVELALIAYNAGPGRADTFRDSGREWSSLSDGVQAETRPYVAKIMKGVGAITPEMAFDPAYGLDFDQALAAEGDIEGMLSKARADANAVVQQRLASAAASQESALNQLYFRAEGGEDFRSMYVRGIANGEVAYDRASMSAGIEISNRVRKTEIAKEGAQLAFARGESLSADQGDFVIGQDVRDGMLAQDPAAITSVVQRSAKMGFVPPATQVGLEQMLYAPDLRTQATGAQIIASLQRSNPGVLRSLPDEMVARAVSLETLRAAGTPSDQMATYMSQTRTPEGRAMLAQAQKSDKAYEENKIPPADIANNWDGYFSGEPSPPTPGQTTLFQIQYGELYDMYYAETLDAAASKELAMAHVAKSWGVTETGGQKQVAWLPPEVALTSFKQDLDGDGQAETIQQTPEQARANFNFAVSARYGLVNFAAVATTATQQALEQGKPVPYGIIPLDQDGNPSYTYDALVALSDGEQFTYDYALAQGQLVVQMNNRDLLKEDLAAGKMPGETPEAWIARRQGIEDQIEQINSTLGGQ
jgi:soluble lytic murein transglycosylase-like protein